MNSDNETPQKESDTAGDSPEESAEKVVGKAKDAKPCSKKKVLEQKKKSRKSGEIEMKRRKNALGRKEKESHLPHQIFQAVTPQQIQVRNQRL